MRKTAGGILYGDTARMEVWPNRTVDDGQHAPLRLP